MYRLLFDLLPDAVFVVDPKTENILESNETARFLYGYTKDEFSHIKYGTLSTESGSVPLSAGYTSSATSVQYHRKNNGSIFPVVSFITDFSREKRQLRLIVIRDLTDCHHNKTTLQRKKDRFQLFFERSDSAALLLDGETFIDCNENALRLMHGTHKDQIVNLRPQDISPEHQPDGYPSFLKAQTLIKTTLREGSTCFEWVHRTFDNREIWTEVSLTAIPAPERQIIHTAWKDIGERKRTKERLKESEERYRVAIEHSNDGIAIVNGDRNIFVNQRYHDIFGYPKSYNLAGKSPLMIVHPDDRPMVMRYITKRKKGEPAPERYEFKGVRSDGSVIYIEVSVTGTMYSGESVSLAYFRDITERKQIENELLKNERKFRELFENAAEGIFRTTPEGTLIVANPAFARMFGYDSTDEVIKEVNNIGRQMYVNPDDRIKIIEHLEKNDTIRNHEVEFVHKSGHKIWISINAIRRRSVAGMTLYYEGTMIDITERRRAEQELIRKEKELQKKSSGLEEANIALKVLLRHREEDKSVLENTVITNFRELVLPYIEKLKGGHLSKNQRDYLDILESNLSQITTPFQEKMPLKYSHLTPTEIQVADLIRRGKSSKEIAVLLNISKHTVDAHRNNIRSKLGLDKGKPNLRVYLENLNK